MRKFDNMLLGAAIGIITSILSLIVFYYMRYDYLPFEDYINTLFRHKAMFAPLISMAGIPNLILFFLFLNRQKYKTARGLILATFILVIAVGIIKLFG